MPRIEIIAFEFTDHAINKLWAHRIEPEQLYAVLANRHVITRNRHGRAARTCSLDAMTRAAALPSQSRRPMIG